MRKQHNVKSTPSFTRAFVELELFSAVNAPLAWVDGREVERRAVTITRKVRREPCLNFCLPGVLGEGMAS